MGLQFNPVANAPDRFAVLISLHGREVLGRRYDYVAELLEEAFEDWYDRLFSSSQLHYEVINLVGLCTSAFASFQFPRRQGNKALEKAITAIIKNYFKDYGGNA